MLEQHALRDIFFNLSGCAEKERIGLGVACQVVSAWPQLPNSYTWRIAETDPLYQFQFVKIASSPGE